jgi:8-oxo-dGTP diphosphatase
MATLTVVCAIMHNAKGQILLCRRGPGRREAGLWEFPGGKVEHGETLAEALERELREELGIVCVAGRILAENIHAYGHGTIRLVALDTQKQSGEIELHDHDQIAWIFPQELSHYGLAPADIPIALGLHG